MATIPIILSTGGTSGAGVAGEGRNDLVIGETVTLSDTEAGNSGADYLWEFVDIPIDSSASLTNDDTATPTFVPDVTGSYRVKVTVNGVFQNEEVLAVPLENTGARIPSFREKTEYNGDGNAVGWHEAMTFFMRTVDSQSPDICLLPEVWSQTNIPASQSATALTAQVSGLFTTFKMMRAGFITGFAVRASTAVTQGSISLVVTKNGTPTSTTLVLSSSEASDLLIADGASFAAGDLIGVTAASAVNLLPNGTLDLEATIDVRFLKS